MRIKIIAVGALAGMILGVLAIFINPSLANLGFYFNVSLRQQLNFPNDFYSVESGSIYNSSSIIVLLFGFIGGLAGFVASLIKDIFKR